MIVKNCFVIAFSMIILCFKCDFVSTVTNLVSVPSSVAIFERQDMYVYMPSQINLTECSVKLPNGTTITLMSSETGATSESFVKYWGENLEAGDCGVHATNLSVDNAGGWSLRSVDIDKNTSQARFTVTIYEYPALEVQQEELFLLATNSENTDIFINMVPSNVLDEIDVYCTIYDPTNTKQPTTLSHENCAINITHISKAYEGLWTSKLGLEGITEELTYVVNITISEEYLQSGWILNDYTGDINVYCNLEDIPEGTKEEIEYCRFIRPDQAVFQLSFGLGNGRYSYYGNGEAERECGITIEQPTSADYGTWKCIVQTTSTLIASSVTVTQSQNMLVADPTEYQIRRVVLGAPAVILCEQPNPLQTCIIVSPLEIVSVGESSRLSFGECLLTLAEVKSSDNGIWTCYMSVDNSVITSSIGLIVQDKGFSAKVSNIIVESGEPAELFCQAIQKDETAPASLKNCRFQRPDGTSLTPPEDGTLLLDRYRYSGQGLYLGECGLQIDAVNKKDNGTWSCFAQLYGDIYEVSSSIDLEIKDSAKVEPDSFVSVKEEDIYFKLAKKPYVISTCEVITPDGIIVDLSDSNAPGISYWGSGFESGDCGFRISSEIRQTENNLQKWVLRDSSPSYSTDATVWVGTIEGSDVPLNSAETLVVSIGGSVNITCNENGALYCTIVPPGKDSLFYNPGTCVKSLDTITSADVGIWKCYIGFGVKSQEVLKTVTLILKDENEEIGSNKSAINDVAINVYCNIKQHLKFCRFLKPNGEAVKISDGLCTNDLCYYGKGISKGYCGITIINPKAEDYGTWRCFVGVIDGENIQTEDRVINISKNNSVDRKDIATASVTVGTELKVLCKVETELNYCWVKHPNTSTIPVLSNLAAGYCTAVIKETQFSDAGKWECHMGLSNGEDVLYVEVSVTEAALQVVEKIVTGISTASFICQSVPSGRAFRYCRFIRPDGKGFKLNDFSKWEHYSYNGAGLKNGECGVTIEGLTYEDFGQWRCAALVEGETVEGGISLMIESRGALPVGAIVGTTLGVFFVILLAVLWTVWYTRKRHSSSSSHTTEQDGISRGSSQEIFSHE